MVPVLFVLLWLLRVYYGLFVCICITVADRLPCHSCAIDTCQINATYFFTCFDVLLSQAVVRRHRRLSYRRRLHRFTYLWPSWQSCTRSRCRRCAVSSVNSAVWLSTSLASTAVTTAAVSVVAVVVCAAWSPSGTRAARVQGRTARGRGLMSRRCSGLRPVTWRRRCLHLDVAAREIAPQSPVVPPRAPKVRSGRSGGRSGGVVPPQRGRLVVRPCRVRTVVVGPYVSSAFCSRYLWCSICRSSRRTLSTAPVNAVSRTSRRVLWQPSSGFSTVAPCWTRLSTTSLTRTSDALSSRSYAAERHSDDTALMCQIYSGVLALQ